MRFKEPYSYEADYTQHKPYLQLYMHYKKNVDFLLSPVLGFFPLILYAILRTTMEQEPAPLIIVFIFSIVGELYFRTFSKSRLLGMTFVISAIAMLLTFITWTIFRNYLGASQFYIIVCEIYIVLVCKLLLISKNYINLRLFKKKSMRTRVLLDDFYFVISLAKSLFIVQLFWVLASLYLIGFAETMYTGYTLFLYTLFPIIVVLIAFVIHILFKVNAFKTRLNKEEWLPIVSERGEVTGKIAKSVSINMKNRFLHPIVRIAFVYDGKVYLQERRSNDSLDPGKLDYPFEKYVLFNHQINISVRNSIAQILNSKTEFAFEFLLKYTFENENTKRLIFLFAVKLDNEDLLPRSEKLKGKFWSPKQIEEVFDDGILSECFELEYEYLKNKALLNTF